MASPPFSLCAISFPAVTKEQFNTFHAIDRELYSTLIHSLGRDPSESMRVMGFWLWLEQEITSRHGVYLIKRLLSLPLIFLNKVADESRTCLKCVESDVFFSDNANLFLLPKLLERGLTLKQLHENRLNVLQGVTNNVNKICLRAFEDIVPKPSVRNVSSPDARIANQSVKRTHGTGFYVSPLLTAAYGSTNVGGFNTNIVSPAGPSSTEPPAYNQENVGGFDHAYSQGVPLGASSMVAYNNFGLPRDIMSEMFSHHQMRTEENKEVPAEERTIFLTFSKGYPISEDEVRDFFTRKYGDFIEEIHMQEVGRDEQPLYARLVSKSVPIMYDIMGGGRAKYSINGKHVWARKYTNNQHPPN